MSRLSVIVRYVRQVEAYLKIAQPPETIAALNELLFAAKQVLFEKFSTAHEVREGIIRHEWD